MADSSEPVLIIGAGVAGLCCARVLRDAGIDCLVLEASDDVGGRIRTDKVEDFLLDRGFQVYLTRYPETARFLDLGQLTLNRFEPGAMIHTDDGWQKVLDPRRRPERVLSSALAKVGTLTDKITTVAHVANVRRGDPYALLERPQTSTLEHLRHRGFSEAIIGRFFRPFYAGIFLEPDLDTSSRFFDFTFRMFAEGDTVLPTGGMQVIPRAIAAALPKNTVRLKQFVWRLEGTTAVMGDGERIAGRAVVVAADADTATTLLGAARETTRWNGTACVYFVAPSSPLDEPLLALNGTGRGIINHLCVPTDVAPSYGPPGRSLISVSTVGVPELTDESLLQLLRDELLDWFGESTRSWRHLRTYRIPRALPSRTPAEFVTPHQPVRVRPGVYVAGDHVDTPSTNGAMHAGRRAAEAILEDLPSW